MKRMAKAELRYFLLHLRSAREYRANWLLGFIKAPLVFALQWSLWRFIDREGGGALSGVAPLEEMLGYFLTIQWLGFCLPGNFSEKISSDIRTGTLSVFLARPVHYLPLQASAFLAQAFLGLAVSLVPYLLAYRWVTGTVPVFGHLLTALTGALCVQFLLESCFAVASFWLSRVYGLKHLIMTFFNIAGGKLVPLAFFPSWFRGVALLSPLRAIYAGPADLARGSGDAAAALMTQIFWAFALVGLLVLLWKRGRPLYEAGG